MSVVHWYQSFPDLGIKGRIETEKEFAKIGIPNDLKEKSVLDIGCNSGAYLRETYLRGCNSLNGVEPNQEWRWIARGLLTEQCQFAKIRMFENAEEINMKFDIVMLLSVIHLIDDPQKIIDKAYELTKEHGLLIIEENDRLQRRRYTLPEGAKKYGNAKEGYRSVYHIRKTSV